MNSHAAPRRDGLAVGTRVSVRRSAVPGLPEHMWPRQPGVIIADYSDVVDDAAQDYGRDWAISRRYAVALDDGCLVFLDDTSLEAEL